MLDGGRDEDEVRSMGKGGCGAQVLFVDGEGDDDAAELLMTTRGPCPSGSL